MYVSQRNILWVPSIVESAVFIGTFTMTYYLLKYANVRMNTSIGKAKVKNKEEKILKEKYDEAPFAPGPWSWPIVGNAISLGEAPHLTFDEMTKTYGPIFRIRLGKFPVIVLNNTKVIKEALNRQREVFSGRPHFASYKLISLGLGAVFNDTITIGESWRELKSKMVRHIHTYAASVDKRLAVSQHIWDETVYMTKTLEKMCAESPTGYVDPETVIRVSIGNAVCAMCFGRRYEVDNAQFVQLLSMNKEFGVVISAGSRIDVMPWIKIFPYYKKAANEFQALCLRMENWVLDKVTKNIETYKPGVVRNLIDSLTEAELFEKEKMYHTIPEGRRGSNNNNNPKDIPVTEQVDHRLLSAIVNDIFGAGQDTLSSAFLFVLHYMVRFPDIQKRIRDEILKITGTDRLPTLADRPELPYMEAAFHEIMRHSSFVAITIPHLTLSNTILCGYKVPKSTMVFINQYTANRDPTVWDDPYSFKPERFLKYVSGHCKLDPVKVNKYTIFSTGGRKCPGDELSKIWMMLSMALILHQCELVADPNNPPTDGICYGLTMKPRNLRLKLRRLESSIVT
uniref:cytochrome P450 1B1-like n=1 Tax=Styela clava TaxID=7725 RepID=UPI001939A38F|nr:cytochrome P450 1B1-like [Styela clava]